MGRVYARPATPRPLGLSQQNRNMIVTKLRTNSPVISIRVTAEEYESLVALAAINGVSLSAHIRGILTGTVERPRPALAAGAALLSICATLVRTGDASGVNDEIRQFARDQARLVLTILRLHGQDAAP